MLRTQILTKIEKFVKECGHTQAGPILNIG